MRYGERWQGQQKVLTYLQLEACLCVWEELNEITNCLHARFNQACDDVRDGIGSVEMRLTVTPKIAELALSVFDELTDDEREIFAPYDWEFIPWIVSLVEWHPGPEAPEAFTLPPLRRAVEGARNWCVERRLTR